MTVNAVFVGLGAGVVSVTVGRVTSAVRERRVAASLLFPAASAAAAAATSTVTVPSPLGVTVKE